MDVVRVAQQLQEIRQRLLEPQTHRQLLAQIVRDAPRIEALRGGA